MGEDGAVRRADHGTVPCVPGPRSARPRDETDDPIDQAERGTGDRPEPGMAAWVLSLPLLPFVFAWDVGRAVVTRGVPFLIRRFARALRTVARPLRAVGACLLRGLRAAAHAVMQVVHAVGVRLLRALRMAAGAAVGLLRALRLLLALGRHLTAGLRTLARLLTTALRAARTLLTRPFRLAYRLLHSLGRHLTGGLRILARPLRLAGRLFHGLGALGGRVIAFAAGLFRTAARAVRRPVASVRDRARAGLAALRGAVRGPLGGVRHVLEGRSRRP